MSMFDKNDNYTVANNFSTD